MAAITQQQAEERARVRAARQRAEEEAGELGRQGLQDTPLILPLATPDGTPMHQAPLLVPPVPHTAPPRKRVREPQPEELLTPPPTRSGRARKRPRPSQETAALQRECLEAILRYHERNFRDKERESVRRSWCREIPLALQVETAKSFPGIHRRKDVADFALQLCYRQTSQ